VNHDIELDIALGNSRKTKVWKNKKMLWSELLERMSSTTRTPETMAEYKAMSRDQQSEVKDVGGFVGGYCNNGNRTDIRHRSVLCLDADFAELGLFDKWKELDYAGALYSTHKHTQEKQRFRLVVPLSRNVDPDEYQAIGRRVAELLGIDQFDDTTYTPGRLMYWPSTSQDGDFCFEHHDAKVLNPDYILKTYYDWRDISAWPMSSRVAEITRRTGAKQGDPLEKSGLIGAFCRAYSITEAIEEFVPSYQPCDDPNRYTYTEGSTAAGVLVYDDKFSYSHHATDPASGQLVNAWDLVRLHKFHDLDADCRPDTPTSKRPSYQAMTEFVTNDKRVTAQAVADRTAEALSDFDEPRGEPETEQAEDWRGKLKVTSKGALEQSVENVVTVLKNDPRLSGCVALNEMNHDIQTVKSLPWRKVEGPSQWTDADDAHLRYYLEKMYGLVGKDKIFDAVNITATSNKFHPVRDYLNNCAWDGVPRVDTLLIDYLGAENNEYVKTVTRKALAAAVARIYQPGIKFDYMLTLRGQQGLGKSALIAKLGGPWFSDSFTTLQGKDAYEQVLGVWIMEVGELAGMRKAEVESVKLYISKQVDRFRPAYGRRSQEYPRQCVFIGTTNEAQFLRDPTGNRRFWVVDTPETPKRDMWTELTPEVVRLIWAEAVDIYRKGESLFLDKDMEETARQIQSKYEEENPHTGAVLAFLDRDLPAGWEDQDLYTRRQWLETDAKGTHRRQFVTTAEIWAEALGGNPDRISRLVSREITEIMGRLSDWEYQGNKRVTVKPYGRQRFYKRRET
jgi:predicted P-loop ATPase